MDAEQTQELKRLQQRERPTPVIADDGPDRTLIYGYTVERDTFHVYVRDGVIHRFVYQHDGSTLYYGYRDEWIAELLVPDKRIYPQYSDYEFCRRLIDLGVHVPFTTWEEPNPKRADFGAFMGRIYEEG